MIMIAAGDLESPAPDRPPRRAAPHSASPRPSHVTTESSRAGDRDGNRPGARPRPGAAAARRPGPGPRQPQVTVTVQVRVSERPGPRPGPLPPQPCRHGVPGRLTASQSVQYTVTGTRAAVTGIMIVAAAASAFRALQLLERRVPSQVRATT